MAKAKYINKVRKFDEESWKLFSRKAGAMKHRRDKRQKMQLRREICDAIRGE